MTPLERAIRDRIKAEGSVTVEAYMEACNNYYYATRDPLGSEGDFTTAPEVSQMFGEMIGSVLADCWKRAGAPADTVFAELGPGRGTLAADALRVLRSVGFKGEVHFVETSPLLRQLQAEGVRDAIWHDGVDRLPAGPLLLIANEFFDALPIRQFVGGVERKIVTAAGGLAFDRDGEMVETSPAREAAVEALGRRLTDDGGVALVVDYGHERSSVGDTLQAVRGHGFAGVLEKPGEHDLSAHVDFETLAEAARRAGAAATPVVRQGEWLIYLGIESRAQALSRANPGRSEEIAAALRRLTAPGEMGALFKAMALHSPAWPVPAGFA